MTRKSSILFHLLLLVLFVLNENALARTGDAPTSLGSEIVSVRNSKYARSYTVLMRRDNSSVEENSVCHPAGACEPCPEEEMNEPFCQPFGNRRLLHCVSPTSLSSSGHESPPSNLYVEGGDKYRDSTSSNLPPHHPGKPPPATMPAWESCGRLVPKERADFFEFVLCNVIFAALALSGVLIRSERMRSARAKRLAVRIGVGIRRASSNSWAAMGGMGAVLAPVRPGTAEEGEGLMGTDSRS